MGRSETDSRQSALAETRKRRRQEEGETVDAAPEGKAAKTHRSKRARTASSASESSDSEGKSEGGKGQDSSDYGSEEGEVDESSDSSGSSDSEEHVSAAESDSAPSSPGPHSAGWNRGISAGQVQISLSSMAPKASAPAPAPAPATKPRKKTPPPFPFSVEPPPTTIPTPPAPTHFQKSDISLKLPPAADRSAGESWQDRFQEWTHTLLELNPEQASAVTPELVLGAYELFIDRVCDIHNKKKKAAKQGADLFSQKGSLGSILAGASVPDLSRPRGEANGKMGPSNGAGSSRAAQTKEGSPVPGWEFALGSGPAPQASTRNGNEKENRESVNGVSPGKPSQAPPKQNGSSFKPPPPPGPPPASLPADDNEELMLQQKYFPRFGDKAASEMCIMCLQHGHDARSCPGYDCEHCGAKYHHSSYACPNKRRCAKCKGLGHIAVDCAQGPITRGQEDAMACAHCGRTDHSEKDCDILWRTYRAPESPNKCHSICTFCANCGEEGHFYFDCADSRIRSPKPRTWCEENLVRYLDKNSKRAPISEGRPRPSLRRPELAGRSSDNIYFESDDSDGEITFLGSRVQPKKPVGQINVSSNIRFAGQAGAPPGDSRLPPPATLPARPRTYSDTVRSEARQQDGGRRQPHQLPPRPHQQLPPRPPSTRRGGGNGGDNYQAVPPPPEFQRNPSDGGASRGGSNGNSRGGKSK
ncbi:hypothetical protein IMZ48_20140, partial [Candidatus Bathyarchaeota archaeon]|nr:hypothetical protein [Candidatus Bathyarchaeota archaeon]